MALVFLVLLLAGLAHGILQSEAGRNDWRLRHVGQVDFSVPSLDGQRIFVGTRSGVIAAMSVADGALEWRHELSASIFALSRCSTGLTLLSATHVQHWTEDGFLGWQYALPSPVLAGATHHAVVCSNTGLLVTTPAAVIALQHTGAESWAHYATANWTLVAAAKHDKQTMLIAEFDGQATLRVASLTMPARTIGQENIFTLAEAPSSCVATSTTIYCLSSGSIVAAALGATQLTDLGPALSLAVHGKAFVVAQAAENVRLYHGIGLLKDFPLGTAIGSAAGHFYAVDRRASQVVLLSLDAELKEEAVLPLSGAAEAASVFVIVSSVGTPTLLLRLTDDTLVLVQAGKRVWARPEFLASTVASTFADFLSPKSDPLLQVGVVPRLFNRLASHTAALLALVTGSSQPTARDAFNLHQRIVVATAAGALAGLDSRNGELAYTVQPFGGPIPVSRAALLSLHADGLTTPLYALVAHVTGDARVRVALFDPLSGHVQSTHIVGNVLTYGRIPLKDHSHNSPLVFLRNDLSLEVFPEASDVKAALAAHVAAHPTVLYRAEIAQGLFEGYLLSATSSGIASPTLSWRIRFDPSKEAVVAVASRHASDVIASLGDIIPDGKVLYKFLSPHLLAVATLTQPDAREGGLLTVYVIDTVKGSIVDRITHENAVGPVHIVHADNWFVYSFRDKKNRRWQLNTLDLFDSAGKPPAAGLSSFRLSKPISMSQAFVFPHAITRLGVTVTDASLANRAVIATLASGKVVALSDRLLDARRPLGQAPRTEEMLPYHPMLVVDPLSLLNYNHTVVGVRGITCAPTGLESTSLVLVTGLDTFFTHAAPSKRFDSLSADFNKPILVASLVTLVVATLAAKWKLQAATLKAAWE